SPRRTRRLMSSSSTPRRLSWRCVMLPCCRPAIRTITTSISRVIVIPPASISPVIVVPPGGNRGQLLCVFDSKRPLTRRGLHNRPEPRCDCHRLVTFTAAQGGAARHGWPHHEAVAASLPLPLPLPLPLAIGSA